jgi:hypothetical protein
VVCLALPVVTGGGLLIKGATKAVKAVDAATEVEKVVDIVDTAVDTEKQITKTNQVHHLLTNKSKTYTKGFEDIVSKYGLDLNGSWNKVSMPHKGRHPNQYHDFMKDRITDIDMFANGNADIFLSEFSKVKQTVTNNPFMLRKEFWR